MPSAAPAAAAAGGAPSTASSSTTSLPLVEAIPDLSTFPPTGEPEHAKLSAWDFWASMGSPRRVVAPMVDQSELAWRVLSRKHGAQLVYTPMINVRNWHAGEGSKKSKFQEGAFSRKNGEEGQKTIEAMQGMTDRPLLVQFCANDPELLLSAARDVEAHCDGVDLNLGCPQHIAKRGHYGAYLMEDWPLIFRLVNTLHLKLRVPVTAKMRVWPSVEKTVAYAQLLERAGAQVIAVHGRTREMKGHNTGLADWRKIRAVKQAVKVPVIANGNVLYPADVEEALRITGADAVMSAEGNLYTPTIFAHAPTEPSSLYPLAPKLPFPDIVVLANEYLDVVAALKTPTAQSAIRSHLFRLCRPALEVHRELRKDLGQAKNSGTEGEARIDGFRQFLALLNTRLDQDRANPAYLSPPATPAPGSMPLRPEGATDAADDALRPAHIPHWLAQPYFRPPNVSADEAKTEAGLAKKKARAERVMETSGAKGATLIRDVQADAEKRAAEQDAEEEVHQDAPPAKKLRAALDEAAHLKAHANDLFVRAQYDAAVGAYNDALVALPPRPVPELEEEPEEEQQGKGKQRQTQEEESRFVELQDDVDPEEYELLTECAKARAVVYANLAACHLKLEDHKSAVKACTEALADDPDYVKALHRRAQANEALGGWGALSSALEDYKHLASLAATPSSLLPTLRTKMATLPPKVEEAATKEKEEMMGKLKGIGDSVLGWFGLSTNNFQMTEQPGGGHSLSFVSDPKKK